MRLIYRISFQKDQNPDGDNDPDYRTVYRDVPANIVPVTGGERYRGVMVQAETNTVIETRYRECLEPDMVILDQGSGQQYLIKMIKYLNGRRKHIRIETTEVVI